MVQIQAKEIRLIKKGGKPCRGDKPEVCYDAIQVRSTDDVFQQSCSGSGINKCPKVGLMTVGGVLPFDVDVFVFNIEQDIVSGVTSRNGVIHDSNNEIIASYSWTGLVNSEGFIEFQAVISDEV